jgi:periplasmic divalent cation tolerance protein
MRMLPQENQPNIMIAVFVTAPDLDTARKIAQAALQARAAACANLVPQIESHYWWEGKIETSAEVLIIFKTKLVLRAALEQIVRANHPYKVPEFVAFNIDAASGDYFDWVSASVGR